MCRQNCILLSSLFNHDFIENTLQFIILESKLYFLLILFVSSVYRNKKKNRREIMENEIYEYIHMILIKKYKTSGSKKLIQSHTHIFNENPFILLENKSYKTA